jgi:hypothetical protein
LVPVEVIEAVAKLVIIVILNEVKNLYPPKYEILRYAQNDISE